MNSYLKEIKSHYEGAWSNIGTFRKWNLGPIHELPVNFSVLEFEPTTTRDLWTYATCGMSKSEDKNQIELHIFSPTQDKSLVELLTVISHYHNTSSPLDLNHTLNFGRPWLPDSLCEHGLISLPYLDGPQLETLTINNSCIYFFWLIPITYQEVSYKRENGIEALEVEFEKHNFNYANPYRKSVV
jgi:Suppressor of fused protein (SUFU)